MSRTKLAFVFLLNTAVLGQLCHAQSLPLSAGETLSGKRIALAEAVHGKTAVLIAGFSHKAGDGCAAWAKAIHADADLSNAVVYQLAMLEGAPAMLRGMIKSGMRKGVPPAEQDHFVVFTQDDKLWRSFFGVSSDQQPYVVLLDATGKVLWHGHGDAAGLEPQLKTALP